jgi:GH24 family phage-related lysozyme (muramidase)
LRYSDPSGHKECEEEDENGHCITTAEKYNLEIKKSKDTYDPKHLKLSDKGKDFIFDWETFSDIPYNDGRPSKTGNCTIGYGTLLHEGTCDGRDKYWRENPISKETAEKWADKAIAISEQVVRDNVKVKLTQSQFDVLVSYVYNGGGQPGQPFLAKGIPELLNHGKFYEAALAIDAGPYTGKNIGYAPGLENRRHQEATIFLSGY